MKSRLASIVLSAVLGLEVGGASITLLEERSIGVIFGVWASLASMNVCLRGRNA